MRTIVHLSDLHFGRTDARLLEPLRRRIEALAPHLVVVSGDLTQRARANQFREARRFLDSLPKPQLVIPGNHDVPFYNVLGRFMFPLYQYRRHITRDLEPAFFDDEIAAVGVNTARSLTFKGGRINQEQATRLRDMLCALPDHIIKFVVTHHPFDIPASADEDDIVGRADMVMETLRGCGVDVLLSGHLHTTHTGDTTTRYKPSGDAALLVQAGTATSTRERGESNSFNVLHTAPGTLRVDQYSCDPSKGEFALAKSERFAYGEKGWAKAA